MFKLFFVNLIFMRLEKLPMLLFNTELFMLIPVAAPKSF